MLLESAFHYIFCLNFHSKWLLFLKSYARKQKCVFFWSRCLSLQDNDKMCCIKFGHCPAVTSWSSESLYCRILIINYNLQKISPVDFGVCPMQLFHFWSRDVHPVQNLLLCTKFNENRMIFSEIWRYIDFQNGSHPPSWNCFTTIRDHPRSLCCWPQLPVKFHGNLIHRSEDIAIWIFRIFGLKCLFRPPKWGFWGDFGPLKCNYSSSRPPKGTSLCKSASVKLSTVKIRWGVWPVGELTESVNFVVLFVLFSLCIYVCVCIFVSVCLSVCFYYIVITVFSKMGDQLR